jgi:hypothetical protein
MTTYTVVKMSSAIEQMQAEAKVKLAGNMVAGFFEAMARSVQLEYGVAVIGIGIILQLAAAAYRHR